MGEVVGMTRHRKHREALELGSFLRRMSRALVRRAAEGDLDALEVLALARDDLDAAIGDAARALHDEFHDPYSWTEIGRVLGVTRQAARQAYSTNRRGRA